MQLRMKESPRSLCDTCRHAVITRALGSNEREIRCRALSDRRVPPMTECSEHRDRTMVALHEMREIAWHVRPLSTGKVEIVHPDEIQPRKKYVMAPGFLVRYDED